MLEGGKYFHSGLLLLTLLIMSLRDSPAQLSAGTGTIGHLPPGAIPFSTPIYLYGSHTESHLTYKEENQR